MRLGHQLQRTKGGGIIPHEHISQKTKQVSAKVFIDNSKHQWYQYKFPDKMT